MTDTHDDPISKAGPARRVEIFTGAGRRRSWSASEKARIVAESRKPGTNVSALARMYGLVPAQIFSWRRLHGGTKQPSLPALSFARVVAGDTQRGALTEVIEITFKDVNLRLPGSIRPSTIMALLKALRPQR